MTTAARPIVFESVDDAYCAMTTAFNERRFEAAHVLARRLRQVAGRNPHALRREQWAVVVAVLETRKEGGRNGQAS